MRLFLLVIGVGLTGIVWQESPPMAYAIIGMMVLVCAIAALLSDKRQPDAINDTD